MNGVSGRGTAMSSGEARRVQVINHILRYRISTGLVLEREFGTGIRNVLQDLLRAQRLYTVPLRGKYTYYLPTRAELRQRGIKGEHRAAKLRGNPLHNALATLWFCFMGAAKRRLLTSSDLATLIPDLPISRDAHCLEFSASTNVVHRLYVPGTEVSAAYILTRIRHDAAALLQLPTAASWLRAQHLAFAVLVENDDRRLHFEDELVRLRPELPDELSVSVHLAPSQRTYRKEFPDNG